MHKIYMIAKQINYIFKKAVLKKFKLGYMCVLLMH